MAVSPAATMDSFVAATEILLPRAQPRRSPPLPSPHPWSSITWAKRTRIPTAAGSGRSVSSVTEMAQARVFGAGSGDFGGHGESDARRTAGAEIGGDGSRRFGA